MASKQSATVTVDIQVRKIGSMTRKRSIILGKKTDTPLQVMNKVKEAIQAIDKPVPKVGKGGSLTKMLELSTEQLAKNGVLIPDGTIPDFNKPCPICGSKMFGKQGKFGVFFGCDNWPNCPATANKNGTWSKKTQEAIEQFKSSGKEVISKESGEVISPAAAIPKKIAAQLGNLDLE